MDYEQRKQSLMSEVESQKVEIYFSCKNMNTPVSQIAVYLKQTNKPRKLVLKSKQVSPQSSLDIAETLVTEYFFEIRQQIIVQVIGNSFIGISQSTIGQIFSGRDKGVLKEIKDNQGKTVGNIWFRSQKVQKGNNKYVQFNVVGRNLEVGSLFLCFGETTSFFRMYKIKNGAQYLLHQSQTRDGKNPRFNYMKISEKRLCNNIDTQPIIIRMYNSYAVPTVMGECQFNLQMLAENQFRYGLHHNGKEKGGVFLEGFKRSVKYDFMDYLTAGMQMAMVVCIDYTASNGIQTSATSLHYNTALKKSQYQEALHETANIVLDYDTDKLVPCFGFGAKVQMPTFSSGGKVHHCFPLNGNTSNPNLFGLDGIIQGYRGSLQYLSFSGPTFFAPLLSQAMLVCQTMKKQTRQYMILMILTDGQIHDIEEVKDLLVKCGRLPLSIIIVGIGNNENWGLMNELDDDDCQMRDKQGNKTERDLVQFVVFKDHNNNGVELAREVLEELPRQVEQYNMLVGLTPASYAKNPNDANRPPGY